MSITINSLIAAIYIAEGGSHTSHPYGIMGYHTESPALVCRHTIEHALRDYKGKHVIDSYFINFLSNRYCPPSVDSMGNKHWRHNVKAILHL